MGSFDSFLRPIEEEDKSEEQPTLELEEIEPIDLLPVPDELEEIPQPKPLPKNPELAMAEMATANDDDLALNRDIEDLVINALASGPQGLVAELDLDDDLDGQVPTGARDLMTGEIQAAKDVYNMTSLSLEQSKILYKMLEGVELTEKEKKRYDEIEGQIKAFQKKIDKDETFADAVAAFAPFLLDSAIKGGKGALAGASIGAVTGAILGNLVPGAVFLPEEALTAPGGALLGGKIGAAFGSADNIRKIEAGLAYKDYIKELDPKTAAVAAHSLGIINAGFEFAGLKFGLGKLLPKKAIGRIMGKATKGILNNPSFKAVISNVAGKGAGIAAETGTEVIQELNNIGIREVARSIMTDEGLTQDEKVALINEIGETIEKTAATTAKATTVFAGVGLGVDLASIEGKPSLSAQDIIDILNNIKTAKETIAAQDVKAPDTQYKTINLNEGQMVVQLNTLEEAGPLEVQTEGRESDKETSRVSSLLDAETSKDISSRGTQTTDHQARTALGLSEAEQKQFDEHRGEMEKKLQQTAAVQELNRFQRADQQFVAAVEAGDYDQAEILLQQLGDSSGKLQEAYTGALAAYQKELGAEKEVNPQMIEVLEEDAAYRADRIQHLTTALRGAEARTHFEQNQELIDKLSNPNTIKQTLIDFEVSARNAGNTQAAKIYDRQIREINKQETKGPAEYLKSTSVDKLIDLKSDIEQHIASMTEATPFEEVVVFQNMLDKVTDDVIAKREYDVGQEELDIKEAEAKEKAQEAKKVAAEKAKKTPEPTPLKKLVKRAEAKKVKPVVKKKPSKLQAAVERRRAKQKAERQKKERSRLAALAKKAREKKARVSPKGAVNTFRFSDGSTISGATSGEIFEKASPAQKKEMEAGTAIEGFTTKGKFTAREKPVKVSDLKSEDRTFGIITAENPKGKPASKLANRQAMNKLKDKLSEFGLPIVEVKGKFGVDETSFVVEGIDKHTLVTLAEEFDQEAVIHIRDDRAEYVAQGFVADKVARKDIATTPDATDFFTTLPDGTKFQIPFFQETVQKAESAGIVLDLTNLRAQGQDFLTLVESMARHIKLGKRNWLHRKAKAGGVKYYFITEGEIGLAKHPEVQKLQPKIREAVIRGFDETLGIYTGSATPINGIFINVDVMLGELQDLDRVFETVDHEALHAVVTKEYGKSDTGTRAKIRAELRRIWNEIPEDAKHPKSDLVRGGWTVGNYFIQNDPDGKGIKALNEWKQAVAAIDRSIDEMVTYAFTQPHVARWLDSMQSDVSTTAKPLVKSFWQQLKETIIKNIGGLRTKLDDVQNVMDSLLQEAGGDPRFSIGKPQPQRGMSKTKVNLAVKPLQAKAKNAAKAEVHTTEADLPKHLQLSPEAKEAGTVVEAVYDPETDTVHFVAENLQDEAHVLRKWLHENVTHKGLRGLFLDDQKFNRFLQEAYGIAIKNENSKLDLEDIAKLYFGVPLTGLTTKQKMITAEEWLARKSEKMDLKVRKGILAKFTEFLKKWLPKRFVDVVQKKRGQVLTEDDLMTTLEAAKSHILGRNPKIVKAIQDSFYARAPKHPSSIGQVKFVEGIKQYVAHVMEVMKTFPQAKQWYNQHRQMLENFVGPDHIIFNMLLSITSPQTGVKENVAHAVKTYAYMLGQADEPGGFFKNQVKNRVDTWTNEEAIIDNIGEQYKVNEFIRGLLGDPDATVLDIWMHRLFFGQDIKAVGQEAFTTVPATAARQMLKEIANELKNVTGENWTARDTQAVLWTWIKAKQEGVAFKDIPNYEMGMHTPSTITDGKTPFDWLNDKVGADVLKQGPLSDMLGISGFENTAISRLEKKRRLQLSKQGQPANLKLVTGKDQPIQRWENEKGTAAIEVNPNGEFTVEFDRSDDQGIGTEAIAMALKQGGRTITVNADDQILREGLDGYGFIEDTEVDGTVEYHMPDWMIDLYRDNRGIVSINRIRSTFGNTQRDIQPRQAHRYSLSKIAHEDGLFAENGEILFLNKLHEWKDQSDLNIQREINKLEQDFLANFGGKKVVGGVLSSGKLKNTAATRLLQKAMNLYIDSGTGSNFEKVLAHKKHLEGKKRTNREKDRLAIINRMLEMTEAEQQWADENIRSWYNEMFQFAKDNDILDTFIEGYVRRAWSVPKDHDVTGAASSGQNAGTFSNFTITTPRAKKRKFQSIIDGWNEGTDWNLKNDAILTNIHNYMNEINEVFTNRRFINEMKGLVDTEGDGLVIEDMTEIEARERGYVRLKARGFGTPFKPMWARKDIAAILNKVTEQGVADLWSTPGLSAIAKINAVIKGTILSLSAFHHFAGLRSWSFGVKKGLKHNGVRAYKRGLDKLENATELQDIGYKLGPIADFMIKHGLTIGKIQDWDQSVLAAEKSVIEGILANRKSAVSRALLGIKRAGRHARENWTRALFGRLFAGLKVEAASVEMAHAISTAERKKGEALTEDELAHEARKVARLINADFGGLHLRRMGRNPNMQKIAQLLLLAPDWTESNFRTVTGMVPGMSKFINRMIGDFPAPAGMDKTYRKFWFGVGIRLLGAYALAYAATYGAADEKDKELLVDFIKNDFSSFEDFKRARWTAVPLDPWLNHLKDEQSKERERWRGFRLGGHFFDILKVMEPEKLIKHKASPLIRTIGNLGTGTDWRGAPYTSVAELFSTGKLVSDSTYEKERNFFARLPSQALYEVRAAQPIWAQEMLRLLQGETSALEASRAGGVDIRPLTLRNPAEREFKEINSEINRLDREMKEARKTRNRDLIKEVKAKQKEYPNFNRTKSRLGYSKGLLRSVNRQLKPLELKLKQGTELTILEQKKLKRLKERKQKIYERFLELIRR